MDLTEHDYNTESGHAQIARILTGFGYQMVWRESGWVEVLALYRSERWIGYGLSRGEALEDLLSRLFPSACSRRLLDMEAGIQGVLQPSPTVSIDLAQGTGPSQVGLSGEEEPTGPEEDIPAATSGTGHTGPEPETDAGADSESRVTNPITPTPARPAPSPAPFPALPSSPIPVLGNSKAHALSALHALLNMIDADRSRLCFSAPQLIAAEVRIRICEARSFEEQYPWEEGVSSLVRHVAQKLSGICRILWPGSVPALKLDSTPYSLSHGRCYTWAELFISETERLNRLEMALEQRGCDDYGYLDQGFHSPAALNPDVVLDEVERLLGGVLANPMQPLPGATLLKSAASLRWIRVSCGDALRWGTAMGMLRQQFQLIPEGNGELLGSWLDPLYTPSVPWGQLIAVQDHEPERRFLRQQALEEFADLMDHIPDGATPADHLLDWITTAFRHLPGHELASLVEPLREQILSLDPESLGDRRIRRRLRNLQSLLGAKPAADAQTPIDDPDGTGDHNHTDEISAPLSEAAQELARLKSRVRERVAGKSALFVSNREDPWLKEWLWLDLELRAEIVAATPRRIDTEAERIQQGNVDIVLYATGFASHKDVNKLSKAARSAGIPFIKVAKGRPLSCLLALARDLGLS